jgi:dTMP kinase
MFITFEGIDGCGKTTQLKMLAEKLKERGQEVMTIREPGGTDFSENIRRILLSDKSDISPVTELLLFESARSHLIDKVIAPALESGKIVLCDRFFDSTTAYQGYGRGLDISKVISINLFATNGIKPDLTFFFDIAFEKAGKRNSGKIADRIESAGHEFFDRVSDGFRRIAMAEPDRFITIDAAKSIEEIHNEILNILDNRG